MSMEDILSKMEEKHSKHQVLLDNIKENMPELEKMLGKVSGLSYEDRMYRFYHYSLKVYWFQELTNDMLKILKKISPYTEEKDGMTWLEPFCNFFNEIINEGTGWEHKLSHNQKWGMVTRPIVEAFLHSKYFIEMAVKYGNKLDEAPKMLPSGWAALLELYKIR